MLRAYRGRLRRARPAADPPAGCQTGAAAGVTGWFVARVRGHSMRPTLTDGDLLLVARARPVTPGCLVVVRLPDATVAVKRATHLEPTGWWVERDNPRAGVDSWTLGPIPHDDVLGVVVLRGWPRPARLTATAPPR
ncbi:MAG: S24 family peptidase [Jiangellales bacterium]